MWKKISALVLLFALALAPFVFGQAKSGSATRVEEELKQLDHKWLDSERTGDLAYCEKFFAESYVLVFPNGQMYTKEQWLGILRGPDRPTLEVLNPQDITVRLFGNAAILTDRTTIRGHDSKGNSLDGEYIVFRVVIKQNGDWRATGVVMNQLASK